MDFENETPFACAATRAQLLYRDLLQAIVVAKATFAVKADGTTALAAEQRPVLEEDADFQWWRLETELYPVKAGCDVAVLGEACAPRGKRVQRMTVSARIGASRQELVVTGDRMWKLGWDGPRPSRPRSFATMPITYQRAYGGLAREANGSYGMYFENPGGRGFLVDKDEALGTLLPNVEDPQQLIKRWNDRPPVAGLAPLPRDSSLRGQRGVVVDLQAQTTRLQPAFFTWGPAALAQRRYQPGERVELAGFRPDGPWRLALPEFNPVLQVQLGDLHHQLPITVDTVYLLPGAGQVVVAGRFTFVYQFVAGRKRLMRLARPSGLRPPGLVTTIAQQRRLARPSIALEPDVSPQMAFLPVEQWLAANPIGEILDRLPLFPSS